MLDQIDTSTESGLRDRAIIELLYSVADRVQDYLDARTDSLPALFLNNSRNLQVADTSENYRRITTRSVAYW